MSDWAVPPQLKIHVCWVPPPLPKVTMCFCKAILLNPRNWKKFIHYNNERFLLSCNSSWYIWKYKLTRSHCKAILYVKPKKLKFIHYNNEKFILSCNSQFIYLKIQLVQPKTASFNWLSFEKGKKRQMRDDQLNSLLICKDIHIIDH